MEGVDDVLESGNEGPREVGTETDSPALIKS